MFGWRPARSRPDTSTRRVTSRAAAREILELGDAKWAGMDLSPGTGFTYVRHGIKVTHMQKTQVYLRQEELDALRKAAARSGRSIAELIRDAIRKVVLRPQSAGPVAIWDGEPRRSSVEHDSVHDEP